MESSKNQIDISKSINKKNFNVYPQAHNSKAAIKPAHYEKLKKKGGNS